MLTINEILFEYKIKMFSKYYFDGQVGRDWQNNFWPKKLDKIDLPILEYNIYMCINKHHWKFY